MKRSSKRLLASVIAIIFVIAIFGGCATKKAEKSTSTEEKKQTEETKENKTSDTEKKTEEKKKDPITLTFWHTYGDKEDQVFKDVVLPMWNKEHPDITIEAVRQDSSNYNQMIVTGFGTGEVPDVARIDIVNTASYAAQGGLTAIDALDASFDASKSDFLEGPLSTNYFDGHYYGLPLDTNCKAAVINLNKLKEIGLNEVPKTIEEYIEAAKKSNQPLWNVSGVGDWDLYPYFWLFGGVLTDENVTKASGYLNSQQSIDAVNKIVELHNNHIFTIKEVDGTPDAWDGISAGDYAMFFEGPWFFGSYEDTKEQGIVPALIPTYNGKSASVVGGENIVVFATGDHQKEAYEFSKFMTSKEVQLAMLTSGQLPVLSSLVESSEVTNNPVWAVYMKQMESANARIPSPEYSAITTAWSDAMTNIFSSGADVKEELDTAAATIDGLLSE